MKQLLPLLILFTTPIILMAADPSDTPKNTETAIFAGGCFWCEEAVFDDVPGILSATSGYTGGHTKNPTYEDVVTETTGHYESVKITYDPSKISYNEILKLFWHNVDPFDAEGQFCDKGPSYRSAIFYLNSAQKQAATESKKEMEKKLGKPIATQIIQASTFYPAEEYHQEYHKKNPIRYKFYRFACGRDKRLNEVWDKK